MQGERIGPYRLAARLGAGGMGEVYKAYDERLDRWVAVKRISPQRSRDAAQRERLLREARASARLSHPAIVQVFDLLQADGADCIVMELVEGTPLSSLLHKGPLEWPRAVALAREIAAALGAAHAQRIVHRDLKTENVMVTPDWHAKVFDFGISKRVDAGENEPSLTREGFVVGTLRAMAPEQAQGKEVDSRADLFSFGVLLYEMLTARSPFETAGAAAMLHRLCYEPHTPLREIDSRLPAELSFLVDRLLEKNPEHRPAGAGEVAAVLAAIGGEPRQEPAAGSATLLAVPPPPAPLAGPGAPSAAERRQVTVLSCGLVRASGGGPPDPEEMIEAMPLLQIAAVLAARRFEGRVAPGKGEDCRVYFGDLQAHEDDARRAVHTALEIVSRCGDWKDGLAVRIGIHTGPMVVTRAAAPEAAHGEAPGIAALLKNLAGAGTVVVSESIFRLVEGWFECEALGAVTMPAAPQPLQLYRVVAERGARNRVQGTGALTPLVAREQELSALLARWDLAREGRGQVVLVSGEAGIGKSRLVLELCQSVQAGGDRWLEGHGSPFHRDSPLHPVVQWLERWIGGERSDPAEAQLERLAQALSRNGVSPEAVPLVAALLSLPTGERYPMPPLSPEAQRRKTLEALLTLLLNSAERRPLLVVIEDLHWVDPSTLELLGSLAAQAEAVPLLLVLTFRPEFAPAWPQRSSMTRLTLGLLSRSQAGLMIDRLTAGRQLSPAQREQIAARTDGVPLFIEEMTKMVLESAATVSGEALRGPAGLPPEVPDTLGGWLMARLDRLGTAKEVAQLAATLGREFSHELLLAVSPWSEEDLGRELDRLVQAELLFRRGLPPRVRYVFKHALLQDAAYASLLKSDRQRHHRRIAQALMDYFPEIAEGQPELVAHHCTMAAMSEPAVDFWRRAGEKALLLSAYVEGIRHLERAISLLADLPESRERDEQESGLQLNLAAAKGATTSWAAPDVGTAYGRAVELALRRQDIRRIFGATRGLSAHYNTRGRPREALEHARRLLERVEGEDSPVLRLDALEAMGFSLLTSGDVAEARPYLEELVALGRSSATIPDTWRHRIVKPLHSGMVFLTWVLWLLGHPDQAIERSREALEEARRLTSAFTLAMVMSVSADLRILRREPEEALPLARELESLVAEQNLPFFSLTARFQLAWLAAEKGDAASGLEAMRRVLDTCVSLEALTMGTMAYFCFLAARLLDAGRCEEGLAAVEQALAVSADGGNRVMDAELLRLKAELLQRLGAAEDDSEEQLHGALDLARRQGARSLELRAAMSLARLWCRRGKQAEARGLLAPVYGWFTEGFDTGDLREARSLLAEIGM